MSTTLRTKTVLLLLFLMSHLAHSRWISHPEMIISDGVDSTITCEPIYGFLPCSSNVWGLVFLIVVYEILLSVGGQLIASGSNLFFQMIGPGVLGASLFQLLGTIPQIILVLVSALSSSTEAAQQRATLSMGLIAGTTVMLLTLIWGSSIIIGSYNLSASTDNADAAGSQKQSILKGYGVVTDAETSYTARIILLSLVPFLIILFAKPFSSARRAIILAALINTVILLLAYILYQIFQPWIQNRQFEYLMSKYAKDKLLKLVTRNGMPDTQKIQQLFDKINKNNATVSAAELRLLLLGVRMDEDDKSTERDVENIMAGFDTSGDGTISRDEFMQGMTKLVSDLSNQQAKSSSQASSQNDDTQGLLASSMVTTSSSANPPVNNSWLSYVTAAAYVIAGTVMLCALSEPLIRTVVDFAQAANLSSFAVSYLAIPLAMNYGIAVQSITSARQKSQKSISLTLSAIYGGVYMNNVIGLIVFLAPVYALGLTVDAWLEILVVMLFCIGMNVFVSFCTTFLWWVGGLVVLLYPASLAAVYVITSARQS